MAFQYVRRCADALRLPLGTVSSPATVDTLIISFCHGTAFAFGGGTSNISSLVGKIAGKLVSAIIPGNKAGVGKLCGTGIWYEIAFM
jgi:hypothetical protein